MANIPLLSGPSDPSSLKDTVNMVITEINISGGGGGGGGGGLSNPFDDNTITAPALYASDATSGFGFSSTGLPALAQDGGNCIAEMKAVAGFSQKSEGLQVGGTSDGGGISLLVLAPPSGISEAWLELDSFGNSPPGIELLRISGTVESPVPTTTGTLGYIYFGGTKDGAGHNYGAFISSFAYEDFSDGHSGSGLSFYTASVGSDSMVSRLYIDGDGNTQISNGMLIWGYPNNTNTVAGLPAATSALKGARTFVTDAVAPVFAATLTGMGSVFCPVYCDGASWRAG